MAEWLVCVLPGGILNLLSLFQLLVSLTLKSPSREWSIKYVCICIKKNRFQTTASNL